MKTLLGVVLFADVYILVYHRLLVRHYYEQATGRHESVFGALFSLPPYSALPPEGRRHARRYWMAAGVMVAAVATLAVLTDLAPLFAGFGN